MLQAAISVAKNKGSVWWSLSNRWCRIHLHVDDGHEVHDPEHDEQEKAEDGEALQG